MTAKVTTEELKLSYRQLEALRDSRRGISYPTYGLGTLRFLFKRELIAYDAFGIQLVITQRGEKVLQARSTSNHDHNSQEAQQ